MYSVLNWNNCTEKKHIWDLQKNKLYIYIYTYTVIVESSKFQYIYIYSVFGDLYELFFSLVKIGIDMATSNGDSRMELIDRLTCLIREHDCSTDISDIIMSPSLEMLSWV